MYVFEQNWFLTILHGNYTGGCYLAYLLAIFSFLCDIVFNKGRVTTYIINGVASVIPFVVTVVPC